MNILKFIELLPKGAANIDKIVEGVVNQVKLKHGKLPEDEQEEIIRRRLICHSCEYNNSNIEGSEMKNSCAMCGCSVPTKTACLTCNCGITAHNSKYPDSPLPLKWTAYEKGEHKD